MYADATHMHFLDQQDFNQWSVALDDVQDVKNYLTEELEGLLALIYNAECVGIQTPTAVELTVAECEPGVRGNSATGRTKPRDVGDWADHTSSRIHQSRANASRSTHAPARFSPVHSLQSADRQPPEARVPGAFRRGSHRQRTKGPSSTGQFT